jgi:hypothetical protein
MLLSWGLSVGGREQVAYSIIRIFSSRETEISAWYCWGIAGSAPLCGLPIGGGRCWRQVCCFPAKITCSLSLSPYARQFEEIRYSSAIDGFLYVVSLVVASPSKSPLLGQNAKGS